MVLVYAHFWRTLRRRFTRTDEYAYATAVIHIYNLLFFFFFVRAFFG